jgi:4-diphosphocytidyl-2-C-methyl-D-erythritol kinase
VGRRPDGYHDLQTVFFPIPLADSLEIEEARRLRKPYEFILSGIALPDDGKDNLVVRVFLALQEEFDLPPTSIFLSKHIPAGAGLGGGSSDAAAMMQLLNDYYHLDLTTVDMEQRLAAFGADCPFFVRNKPMYAEGIGNVFTPVNINLKDKYIVLVKPDIHVSTAEAYAAVTPCQLSNSLYDQLLSTPVQLWRNVITNDFEPYVFRTYPKVAAIKQTLYDMGAIYASMSGSGSAVYGIFGRPIDNAAKVFHDCFTFAASLHFS